MFKLVTDYGNGIPFMVYSDRHTIFQSPQAEKLSLEDELNGVKMPLAQFGHCLHTLDICHSLAPV